MIAFQWIINQKELAAENFYRCLSHGYALAFQVKFLRVRANESDRGISILNMENTQLIMKLKRRLSLGFLVLALVVFSCREKQPRPLPDGNVKDAAIREQVEESMEEARTLAEPDSTVAERDSLQEDSVKAIHESIMP